MRSSKLFVHEAEKSYDNRSLIKSELTTFSLFAICCTLLLLLSPNPNLHAQSPQPFKLPTTKVGDLGEIKYFINTQVWARYTDMNPGTTIGEREVDRTFDVSIRRFRFNMSSQLGKVYWKVQFGLNNMNQTFNRRNFTLLDAYVRYSAADYFKVGFGKSLYYGLSRYSALSTSTMITVEVPLLALPTVNKTDDILRRNSVFFEGQIGKFDYNLVFAKPFLPANSPAPQLNQSDFYQYDGFEPSGYFVYRFWDNEGQGSAAPGSYLGKKKLFNLGAGFLQQTNATWSLNRADDTVRHDMLHWAVDVMVDMPLDANNDRSMTFYAVFIDADYGPNYIRNIGINSIAQGTNSTAFYGKGNAYPALGTGTMAYAQAAYRWRAKSIQDIDAFMPFATINYAEYDLLDEPMILYEYGLHVLLNGNYSKLSLGLQHRPLFDFNADNKLKSTDYKMLAVLQYQVMLKS